MTVAQLLAAIAGHAADGRAMNDEVFVKINGDVRPITTSYANGSFIVVAGRPLTQH